MVAVKYVRIYQDNAGEWRWKALAGNHEIVADCGEGYKNRSDCEDAAKGLFADAMIHTTHEKTGTGRLNG